jgi:hypothetical protein
VKKTLSAPSEFNKPSHRLSSFRKIVFAACLIALLLSTFGRIDRAEAGAKKSTYVPIPIFIEPTDPNTPTVSGDAIQVAEILGLTDKLKLIDRTHRQTGSSDGQRLSTEARLDLTDARLDTLETIEQAELEIDYVTAEIEEELAGMQELLQVYSSARNDRIDRLNAYGFRVNGVMWAVAEAFDIPTYKTPKYSIPSGAIGILAGLVPSAFSLYALRAPDSRYVRKSYPNMLSKIFDYPTIPRIEYPSYVWTYLNSKPPAECTKTRRQILLQYWGHDQNITSLKGVGKSKTPDLDTLTGANQTSVTIKMLSDRLTMLRETKAVVMQMSRSLLELSMVTRGVKHL